MTTKCHLNFRANGLDFEQQCSDLTTLPEFSKIFRPSNVECRAPIQILLYTLIKYFRAFLPVHVIGPQNPFRHQVERQLFQSGCNSGRSPKTTRFRPSENFTPSSKHFVQFTKERCHGQRMNRIYLSTYNLCLQLHVLNFFW